MFFVLNSGADTITRQLMGKSQHPHALIEANPDNCL